jgi:hypothetical protein
MTAIFIQDNMQTPLPFETFEVGTNGGFITFELADETRALPLLSLQGLTLRDRAQLIVMQFAKLNAEIAGSKLGELFGLLVAGKIKVLRVGKTEDCQITALRLLDGS